MMLSRDIDQGQSLNDVTVIQNAECSSVSYSNVFKKKGENIQNTSTGT